MTRDDAKIIAAGLLGDGMDVAALGPTGRQELRDAMRGAQGFWRWPSQTTITQPPQL